MHMRKLMIVAAIVMMGSFAITPWVRADDSDKDGVPNSGDKTCKASDISPTISNPRTNRDCGVPNLTGSDGCTAMDEVAICDTSTAGKNKNQFKFCVVNEISARNDACSPPNWLHGAFLSTKELTAVTKCFK